MQLGMARFTGAMMSCPAFAADSALTQERNCAWGQVSGRTTNQDGGNGSSGFSYDSVTYQLGGQRQISPGWFLGGSFAYQNAHLRGDDRRVSGSGDLGYAGVVLKREEGPWTVSGSVGGGYGSYDLNRNRSIPNFETQSTSSPDVYS
ncbi:autotransporter domain-containing protein, partial [Agrobacterium tumefaciens]|uniref:autotransporter domain-containing protein n=1 Tax=Agrobacterium tumefaciens TaxID=358 RepID=UPI003BA1B813